MSSTAAHRTVVAHEAPFPGPAPASRRVLVVRSSRRAEFGVAVDLARARHPGAEIVALSHHGHREMLREAGVDRIIELPGRRFGLLRVAPLMVQRLRRERFDAVVIPQMTAFDDTYVNLYWLVAALRSDQVIVVAPEARVRAFARQMFVRYTLRVTARGVLRGVDAPVFLALLAAACGVRWLTARRIRIPASADEAGPKRVLHVISSLGVGGAQVQLAEVLNRTPRDQYEVELLVLGRSDGDFSRRWLQRDDVEVSFLEEWPRLVPSVLEIIQRCRDRRYDLVHTWLFMANIVGVAGARLAGVPRVIASVRNLSVWKRERWYRKWWHRAADILGSHAADVVTVNAVALVADHARWAWMRRSRIEVVHNGLDPSQFPIDPRDSRRLLLEAAAMPEDAVLVGTVGRLAPEKDQATFIRLLAEVHKSRRDVRGVVIGNGELRPQLERLATDLGLDGAIAFLGERSDARRLMGGLDLFVLTSRSEGFPNVLLEATFLGVPCLATNLAGNPDVLGFGGSLFPAGDVTRGAARALALVADPERTAARQQFTRARALSLFTAERSVAAWLALYRRTLGAN